MRIARKGQNSVEYLAIVGIALMLLIPATILFTNYARNTNDEVLSKQLGLIGNTILSKAEEMYVIGTGSWSTIEISVPDAVKNATIANNNELVLTYTAVNGVSNAVFFSPRFNINNGSDCTAPCDLELSPGLNRVKIELIGSTIKINKVN